MTDKLLEERTELESARDAWATLAENEEREAARQDALGNPYGSTDTYHVRADVYRRTAKSLQMQIDTGVAFCSCCFKPLGGSR